MRCEICTADKPEMAILPIHQEKGNLITIACLDCAKQSGAYCTEHYTPHLGFFDGTTACRECIESEVWEDGERIAANFAARVSSSKRAGEIHSAVNQWLEEINESLHNVSLEDLPLAILVAQTPDALMIAKAIVTKAQRTHTTCEEVIDQVCAEGPDIILGYNFTPSIPCPLE